MMWAVKLCVVCCVLLGVVLYGVLPMVGVQARYLMAATVVALAVQAIGLMVIVTACLVGPLAASWRVRLRHLSRTPYQSYPHEPAPG